MIGIVCAFFHTEGKGVYSSRQLRLYSRGSTDPRESLRRRRISKLALTARKVLPPPDVADRFRILIFTWGGVVESDCGWKEKHKKKITGYGAGERIRGFLHIKMATGHIRLPFLYGVKEGFLGVYLPRSFSPIW